MMFFPVDHHAVQTVIVQDPLVYPLCCSALFENLLVSVSAMRYIRIETESRQMFWTDKPGVLIFQLMESHKKADGIMAFGAGET